MGWSTAPTAPDHREPSPNYLNYLNPGPAPDQGHRPPGYHRDLVQTILRYLKIVWGGPSGPRCTAPPDWGGKGPQDYLNYLNYLGTPPAPDQGCGTGPPNYLNYLDPSRKPDQGHRPPNYLNYLNPLTPGLGREGLR